MMIAEKAACLVLAFALAAPACAKPADAASAEHAAVMKLASDLEVMYEQNDAVLGQQLYSPDFAGGPLIFDGTESPWNTPWTKGYADYMQHLHWYATGSGPFVGTKPAGYQQTYVDPAVEVRGTMAAFASLLDVTFDDPNGKPVRSMGRYTFVARKHTGKWKVWHEHFSFVAQPLALAEPAK